MIVCAAIKFHLEATDSDVILCGVRHGDIFKQLKDLGFKPHNGYKVIEQGFMDNKNRFLNRYEAYEHAIRWGQCPDTFHGRVLYSEDLW